jgi:hypothetical protein
MHFPKLGRIGVIAAASMALAGLAACDRHSDEAPSAKADPSAVVIGTAPAAPTGDPPGTTAVAPGTSDVSKAVEQKSMPLPGQPNDHSNLAPTPSQRAETTQVNQSPEAARTANSDKPSERGQQQ